MASDDDAHPIAGALLPLDEIAARVIGAGAAWGALNPKERARKIRRLRFVIAGEQDRILEALVADTGKPVTEAASQEVTAALAMLRHMEQKYPGRLEGTRFRTWIPGFWTRHSGISFEPLGVIAIIGPSNFPFSLPLMQTASALLCGNTVILKPSAAAPRTAAILRDIFDAGALPAGVVSVAEGGDDAAAALIALECVRKVIFTGRSDGGREIARLCGLHFKPCILELGGSGAAIVCADADAALAARGIAWSAFSCRGRSCVATRRVFVHERVAPHFIAELEREIGRLHAGDPFAPGSDIPLPAEGHDAGYLRAIAADAIAGGATVLSNGRRARSVEDLDTGFPMVILDADPRMRAMREEVSLLAVRTVRTTEQAVREANESSFGLSASIWSREGSFARLIARQLFVGIVWINDAGAGEPEFPWGGVKASGWGRLFSRVGIAELTNVKVVSEDRRLSTRSKFWWYPYTAAKLELLREVNRVVLGGAWRRFPRLLRAAWSYSIGKRG